MRGHWQDINNSHINQLDSNKQIKSTNKQRSSLMDGKNLVLTKIAIFYR